MITITSTASFVQASGIENSKSLSQAGGADNSNTLLAIEGFSKEEHLVAGAGVSNLNSVSQFEGADQNTQILNPSQIETSADAEFVVFPADFSRGAFLSAVVGTTGTIEKFFDRSPFFFVVISFQLNQNNNESIFV